MSIIAGFPEDWKLTVTVTTVTRDTYGKQVESDPVEVPGCLVGWSQSDDPTDLADTTTGKAWIFPPDHLDVFVNGAKVSIPPNQIGPSGVWRVVGGPQKWPLGTVVEVEHGQS